MCTEERNNNSQFQFHMHPNPIDSTACNPSTPSRTAYDKILPVKWSKIDKNK